MNANSTAAMGRMQRADDALLRAESWMALQQRRRCLKGTSGRLEEVLESGGGSSRYGYDGRGDLTEIREPDGTRRRFAYDERRRLLSVAHADGTQSNYEYDESDHLIEMRDRGRVRRWTFDADGRLQRAAYGNSEAVVYRYDERGRVASARTSVVATHWSYGETGRIEAIRRMIGATSLTVHLVYDGSGRLSRMRLPGMDSPIRYEWDSEGKPTLVRLGDDVLARMGYDAEAGLTRLRLGNGLLVERSTDGRPLTLAVRSGDRCLLQRDYAYEEDTLRSDGVRTYEYDALGRLTAARHGSSEWRYRYDAMDRRTSSLEDGACAVYRYDGWGRLETVVTDGEPSRTLEYDAHGRLKTCRRPDETTTYRYDEADRLTEVRRNGRRVARFIYDHKGLLAGAQFEEHARDGRCYTEGGRSERYLYGPSDELLAITDAEGNVQRAFVHTPMGPLAEVSTASDGTHPTSYLHVDPRGTLLAASDGEGRLETVFSYAPYGAPLSGDERRALFGGHLWFPELGLYYCRARWYDPHLGCFITPDTYTGAPDDERLMMPVVPASRQAALRAQLLGEWLKQPRVRNRYAYCGNDPVGRLDPNGHWSVGWLILSILGTIWTLPNTLIGLVIEISCLLLEALRWVLFAVSIGNVRWEDLKSPGFDAAASGRLDAFAVVFEGGWIGSFDGLLGITFGNVFFVNPDWEQHPELGGPGDVFPDAYNGTVALPRREALYEHELRHVNHQSWLGPFFYLALPIWGFFFWDLMINGYCNMVLERDARRRAGV